MRGHRGETMMRTNKLAGRLLAASIVAALATSMGTVAYADEAAAGGTGTGTGTDVNQPSAGDITTEPTPEPEPTPAVELTEDNTKIKLSQTRYLYAKGKTFHPKVTVTVNGEKLASSNYKVSYVADNGKGGYTAKSKVNAPGTYAVKVQGEGTYSGVVYSASYQVDGVIYAAHASKWSGAVKQGSTASASGKKLNGIRISIAKKGLSGSVKYKVLKGDAWTDYVANGETAGNNKTTIQGIQVKLTGDLAKKYTVYYRVKVQSYGWMGWAKNGAKAGTKNLGKKVVAYQVQLKKRGSSAPGYDNLSYVTSGDNGAKKLAMRAKIYNSSSSTKYTIVCSTGYNKVAVFKGSKGDWRLIKFWSCCTGAPGSPTVKGNFSVGSKSYHFGEEKGYTCWYATQFCGNYLFHSVLYVPGSKSSLIDGSLGYNISHGCVRLAIGNAKWIYNTIPSRTHVYVYGGV